jgi:periplasmic protein CpxP/Spy
MCSIRLKPWMLTLLVLFAIPAVGLAQPFGPGGPGGGPMPMPLMMLLSRAHLSPDQQKRVHEIMRSSFAQTQPLMKQLDATHNQIADKLLSPGNVTVADIEPLQQRENRIHQQLDQQMLSTALQIRGVLTREQLARVVDLHKKLQSLREQMDALIGENGPPMGPPPRPF